jgi:hypothetical protein
MYLVIAIFLPVLISGGIFAWKLNGDMAEEKDFLAELKRPARTH